MTAVHLPGLVSQELIDLTRSLGRPERDLVILAEGNTSELLADGRVVVKASGSNMASATAEDFVTVDVAPLVDLLERADSTQAEVTAALDAGMVDGRRRRGSIEALVHVAVQAIAPSAFVGHTHPTAVVGLLASVHARAAYESWVYSDEAVVIGTPLYVPYAQPGIELGRVFYTALRERFDLTGELPQLVLLGNHGIVAIAPTAAGVDGISAMAVKGAQVRATAYAIGGVAPLPAASVAKFFARDDIAERRGNLAKGQF
jgi:rhamnose utilization protein RhaD (predicted bifunctional aldolase and dehydrogenase)